MSDNRTKTSVVDRFFESDCVTDDYVVYTWTFSDHYWTKSIYSDGGHLLVMKIDTKKLNNVFAVLFNFFVTGNGSNFKHRFGLHSVDDKFIPCLEKLKSKVLASEIPDKEQTCLEIDRITDSYNVFSVHEA